MSTRYKAKAWQTSLKTHHYITKIQFHPQGKYLVSLGRVQSAVLSASMVEFWDRSQRKRAMTWQPTGKVLDLVVAPNGRRFATLHADGNIRVWTWPLDRER